MNFLFPLFLDEKWSKNQGKFNASARSLQLLEIHESLTESVFGIYYSIANSRHRLPAKFPKANALSDIKIFIKVQS
jgi:hypothetical protein